MGRNAKRLGLVLLALAVIAVALVYGLPAFAQTRLATLIPGQPLSAMAADAIIRSSGLPIEKLPDGTTSAVTRGRDAVNAYRYAHTMLYQSGWYRGISEDHTPLLNAMVTVLKEQGYTSPTNDYQQVLSKFWAASSDQNAKDLGFVSYSAYVEKLADLRLLQKTEELRQVVMTYEGKWK